jgi:hypothetical protein
MRRARAGGEQRAGEDECEADAHAGRERLGENGDA